ncbi:putative non-specific serine/threonine protein kinase [Dioscorea sansibarensis]
MGKLENLYLYDNSLNESIIPCLNKVSSLKTLDLSVNNMGGNFSLEGLCKIKDLEGLDISYNNMNGEIPVCFGHLSSLRSIDISDNQFGPLFPSSVIRNLTMLKHAIFSNNNFEGILSIDLFFNHTDLKVIDLSNNYQLEIQTQHLGMVPSFQLNEIILSNCILTKPSGFPTFLSNQYMVERIDLSGVNLKGNIPLWLFKNKTKLNTLNLRNNSLDGPLIFPFQKTNLKSFDVSNNKLIGEVPNNIHYVLPNVMYLSMSHNSLGGAIPASFGNLSQLIFLDLSFNNLTGSFPSCIRNLAQLRALNLRENKLEGNLTHEFCHSSNIENLDLSKYNFSDLVSSCINMPNLEYLNINRNRLTGPFPSAILGNSLVVLDIGNNNFIGNIPNKIWTSLKNLKIISLKGNYFEGVLSREICKLNHLSIFDFSQNKLHGKIPSCLHYLGSNVSSWFTGYFIIDFDNFETREGLYNTLSPTYEFEYIEFSTKGRSDSYQGNILNYLSGLDLSGNQLDGKIPKNIGEMTWLKALNLSNNRLTGPIPATLSKLRDIESLDLSHNILVGQIPTQLAELDSLEVFSVAYNNLSGPTIGFIGQFSTFNESSYEGNPYLCGPPLKNNCTSIIPSPRRSQVTNNQDDEETVDRIIFFTSLALGFIIGFWGWMALLYFKRSWQHSFILAIDEYMKEALDMASNLLM